MKKEYYFSVETFRNDIGSNMDELIYYSDSISEIRDDLLEYDDWDYAQVYIYKNRAYGPLFATIYRNGDIDYS